MSERYYRLNSWNRVTCLKYIQQLAILDWIIRSINEETTKPVRSSDKGKLQGDRGCIGSTKPSWDAELESQRDVSMEMPVGGGEWVGDPGERAGMRLECQMVGSWWLSPSVNELTPEAHVNRKRDQSWEQIWQIRIVQGLDRTDKEGSAAR